MAQNNFGGANIAGGAGNVNNGQGAGNNGTFFAAPITNHGKGIMHFGRGNINQSERDMVMGDVTNYGGDHVHGNKFHAGHDMNLGTQNNGPQFHGAFRGNYAGGNQENTDVKGNQNINKGVNNGVMGDGANITGPVGSTITIHNNQPVYDPNDKKRSVPLMAENDPAYKHVVATNEALVINIDRHWMVPALMLRKGAELERSVVRLIISKDNGEEHYGTGFIIFIDNNNNRLLMTNHHCIASVTEADKTKIYFDYYEDNKKDDDASHITGQCSSRFFTTSKELDVTICSFDYGDDMQDHQTKRTPFILSDPADSLAFLNNDRNDQRLFIIQHPGGKLKSFCFRGAKKTIDEQKGIIHYDNDTKPGSSGSPVCLSDWRLVAIHHKSVPEYRNGQTLKYQGNEKVPMTAEDEMSKMICVANEGILMKNIVEHLKTVQVSWQNDNNYKDQLKVLAKLLTIKSVATTTIA